MDYMKEKRPEAPLGRSSERQTRARRMRSEEAAVIGRPVLAGSARGHPLSCCSGEKGVVQFYLVSVFRS